MASTLPTLKNWAKEHYERLDQRATKGSFLTARAPLPLNARAPGFITLIRHEKPKYGLYFALPHVEEHLQPLMKELADLYPDTTRWIIDRVDSHPEQTIDTLLWQTSIPHILKTERYAALAQDVRLAPMSGDGAIYECYGGTFALAAFLARPEASYNRILLLSPMGTVTCQNDEIIADLRAENTKPLLDICRVIDNYLPSPYVSDEFHKWDEDGVKNDQAGVFPSVTSV